eukprot:TRINITY_DN5315_c0_g1_i1.p1 TRINITY_DN5315_c0_g1~~TRINITY_DN5315_c0_g1_i1.p1  ORF type:complete len:568 (+),score=150.60 TRINITY_DN5315_c0_g1_i1:108-1811(+)
MATMSSPTIALPKSAWSEPSHLTPEETQLIRNVQTRLRKVQQRLKEVQAESRDAAVAAQEQRNLGSALSEQQQKANKLLEKLRDDRLKCQGVQRSLRERCAAIEQDIALEEVKSRERGDVQHETHSELQAQVHDAEESLERQRKANQTLRQLLQKAVERYEQLPIPLQGSASLTSLAAFTPLVTPSSSTPGFHASISSARLFGAAAATQAAATAGSAEGSVESPRFQDASTPAAPGSPVQYAPGEPKEDGLAKVEWTEALHPTRHLLPDRFPGLRLDPKAASTGEASGGEQTTAAGNGGANGHLGSSRSWASTSSPSPQMVSGGPSMTTAASAGGFAYRQGGGATPRAASREARAAAVVASIANARRRRLVTPRRAGSASSRSGYGASPSPKSQGSFGTPGAADGKDLPTNPNDLLAAAAAARPQAQRLSEENERLEAELRREQERCDGLQQRLDILRGRGGQLEVRLKRTRTVCDDQLAQLRAEVAEASCRARNLLELAVPTAVTPQTQSTVRTSLQGIMRASPLSASASNPQTPVGASGSGASPTTPSVAAAALAAAAAAHGSLS